MNLFMHWLTTPEWSQLVKALLHSLWQGALIATALALVLRCITRPTLRYRLTLTGLALMVFTMLFTWGLLCAPKRTAPAIKPNIKQPVEEKPVAGRAAEVIVVPANWRRTDPTVQWTAWLALAWLIGASAMLGRASVKVAGAERLRRACQPTDDPRIVGLISEARRLLKWTRPVSVTVTDRLTSPAVVGVLVPTLILPLSLITTLSTEQIRFVLLHELAHIRRGDYLANLFQLLTEALFFFNPAVWWINHQIRREREVCCDALAIELSGAPADYARTLVSVAETALNPSPAAAPAFGNNRESSSLSDRIQRLLVPGYRPSIRLTWRAMLAALALGGALLGLMTAGTRETVAATAALLAGESPSDSPKESVEIKSLHAGNLPDSDGGSSAGASVGTNEHARINIAVPPLRLDELPRQTTFKPGQRLEAQGEPIIVREDGSYEWLDSHWEWSGLSNELKRIAPRVGEEPTNLTVQIQASRNAPAEAIRRVLELLESVGIERTSIVPVSVQETTRLRTRTFKVDPNEFARALGLAGPVESTNGLTAVRDFFTDHGLDLHPPESMFYNDRAGLLWVRAQPEELDAIESLLAVMNAASAQVNIRCKFVETPEGKFDGFLSEFTSATNAGSPFTGILSEPQAQVIFKALGQRKGVKILSTPAVTTLSGRPAQIQAVDLQSVVTGTVPAVTNGVATNVFKVQQIPFGPILAVTPKVSADGQSIHMTFTASVKEFLGYDDPGPFKPGNRWGVAVPLDTLPLPRFRLRQEITTAQVWDGQTVILGGFASQTLTRHPDGSESKKASPELDKNQLLVFITPTIIDPAGTRVHPEAPPPHGQTQTAPQPQSGGD